jgi:hypothetical protein
MNDLIQAELRQVVTDWMDGRRIQAIPLGHPVRLNNDGVEEPHVFRQKKAYDYCFSLIATALTTDKQERLSWAMFSLLTDSAPKDLSTEERQAAESLAWKALCRGWHNAISGFPEQHAIALTREADA